MSVDATPQVVVVEDDRDVADTYDVWLRDRYDLTVVYRGSEAMDAIDDGVDVVLLDRMMTSLSGDEVLARIRERVVGCRVAMLSAVEPDVDVIGMGFDAYLVKPVTREQVVETVERLLARSELNDRLQEYYSLVETRAALRESTHLSAAEADERYAELEREIERLEAEIEAGFSDVDVEDFAALVRDVDATSNGDGPDDDS